MTNRYKYFSALSLIISILICFFTSCSFNVDTYDYDKVRLVTFSAVDVKDKAKVTMECFTPGVKIYYTTDGKNPTEESTRYTSPVTLENDVTLKAIAYRDDQKKSNISKAKVKNIKRVYEKLTNPNDLTINGKTFEKTEFVTVIPKGETRTIPDDGNCTLIDDYFWGDRVITISGYSICKYAVTQELYKAVMGKLPYNDGITQQGIENIDLRPVAGLNWFEAVLFCNKLSALCGYECVYTISDIKYYHQGKSDEYIRSMTVTWNLNKNGFRLPTEAEWEYASRGAGVTADDWSYRFSGSDYANEVAWTVMNSYSESDLKQSPLLHEVGLKKPNALGLYDMSGNVSEWCMDWFRTIMEDNDSSHGNAVKAHGAATDPI